MIKLTRTTHPTQELDITQIEANAEKIKSLFEKQIGNNCLEINLLRKGYFNHDDDDNLAYVMEYSFTFSDKIFPEYSLYFYANEECNAAISFLGMLNDSRGITIAYSPELNTIPKVILDLEEAETNANMYDVEFDFKTK